MASQTGHPHRRWPRLQLPAPMRTASAAAGGVEESRSAAARAVRTQDRLPTALGTDRRRPVSAAELAGQQLRPRKGSYNAQLSENFGAIGGKPIAPGTEAHTTEDICLKSQHRLIGDQVKPLRGPKIGRCSGFANFDGNRTITPRTSRALIRPTGSL